MIHVDWWSLVLGASIALFVCAGLAAYTVMRDYDDHGRREG